MTGPSSPQGQLLQAVLRGRLDAARDLLRRFPELSQDHDLLNDLLRDAALADNVEMLALLAEFGADMNAPEAEYHPEGAIDGAAHDGAIHAVRWLLERGAKINLEVDGTTRCFPLVGAARNGHLEIVKLLLDHGANINAVWAGKNALSHAMIYGQKEIEEYLRSKGAKEPWELTGGLPPPAAEESSILAHYERHYGARSPLALREIVATDPPVTIHCFTGAFEQVLGTEGMSSRPMNVPDGSEAYQFAELVMFLPLDWPLAAESLKDSRWSWPIEWLRKLAHYPHDNDTSLGGPASVIANGEPPQPLGPNTELSCFLVMAADADRGWLARDDGSQVVFFTLLPLYREERDLDRAKGTAHLLRLLRAAKINFAVNVSRPNVAVK